MTRRGLGPEASCSSCCVSSALLRDLTTIGANSWVDMGAICDDGGSCGDADGWTGVAGGRGSTKISDRVDFAGDGWAAEGVPAFEGECCCCCCAVVGVCGCRRGVPGAGVPADFEGVAGVSSGASAISSSITVGAAGVAGSSSPAAALPRARPRPAPRARATGRRLELLGAGGGGGGVGAASSGCFLAPRFLLGGGAVAGVADAVRRDCRRGVGLGLGAYSSSSSSSSSSSAPEASEAEASTSSSSSSSSEEEGSTTFGLRCAAARRVGRVDIACTGDSRESARGKGNWLGDGVDC